MKALRIIVRAIDRLSLWVGFAVTPLMPIMMLILFIEVAARYVFQSPTIWAYDSSVFVYGYLGLLGGAYALRNNAHINVDFFYARLSRRGQAVLDVISGCLAFFFLALMIMVTWKEAMNSIIMKERTYTEWSPPMGHMKLMIPISAALMLLQGLANWTRSLYRVVTDRELEK